MSEVTPTASPANVARASKAQVLLCRAQPVGYDWGNAINVSAMEAVTFDGSGPVLIINPGMGYYDGTWFYTYLPFAQKTNNPFVYIVPNYTGLPKAAARPGVTDPATGLFYDIAVQFPLIYTFGKNWAFVSVADFSASVGQDVSSPSLPSSPANHGIFAVRKIAPPTSDDSLSVRYGTPILSNVFNTTLSFVNAIWTYTYSYDVTAVNNSGTFFTPDGFQTNVTQNSTGTNQLVGINQIIGAQSGKVIDLASLTPAIAASFDTSEAFGSTESFYPNFIVLPLVITPPPYPVIPPNVSGAPGNISTITYTPKRFWLSNFGEEVASEGSFLQFIGGHTIG